MTKQKDLEKYCIFGLTVLAIIIGFGFMATVLRGVYERSLSNFVLFLAVVTFAFLYLLFEKYERRFEEHVNKTEKKIKKKRRKKR